MPLEGHIGVGNATGMGLRLLRLPDFVGHAQVDDALDAKPGEVLDAASIGLGAAKEAVADLAEVGNALRGRQTALSRRRRG